MLRSYFVVVSMLLLSAARSAGAQPLPAVIHPMDEVRPPRPPRAAAAWSTRRFSVDAQMSAGGPFGTLGAAYEVAPNCCIVFQVGAGGSVAHGLQLGAMGRFRLPLTPGYAFGPEEGFSTGRYERGNNACDPPWFCSAVGSTIHHNWDHAVWNHLGLSFEGLRSGGLHWRAVFGWARLLNTASSTCTKDFPEAVCSEPKPVNLPYVGSALGYSF